jgi:hypothetical protein
MSSTAKFVELRTGHITEPDILGALGNQKRRSTTSLSIP